MSRPEAVRVLLIGCGKDKVEETVRAEELYTGSLFAMRAAYANASGLDWSVLSAMHGVLGRDVLTAPYDLTASDLSRLDAAAWSLWVAGQILDGLEDGTDPRDVVVELHAGKAYADQLERVLLAVGVQVDRPLRGLGIGAQRGWYSRARA